jgi:hypothetical protein
LDAKAVETEEDWEKKKKFDEDEIQRIEMEEKLKGGENETEDICVDVLAAVEPGIADSAGDDRVHGRSK